MTSASWGPLTPSPAILTSVPKSPNSHWGRPCRNELALPKPHSDHRRQPARPSGRWQRTVGGLSHEPVRNTDAMIGWGCMNASGASPTVFSIIEKIVSGAQKIGSASEKSVWVTPTIVWTRKNIVWIVQTIVSMAGKMVAKTSTYVAALEKIVARLENIFSQPKTLVGAISTVVGATQTLVSVSETLVWETKTLVAKPQTIFRLTRKIVAAIMNIFSFEQTMF